MIATVPYQTARTLLRPDACIELISILSGLKPAMRQVGNGSLAERLRAMAADLGLAFDQSEFALGKGYATGCITHSAQRLKHRPLKDDLRYVYIGADPMATKLAKAFDVRDNKRFGAALGYPSCCTSFFQEHYGSAHPDLVTDTAPPARGRYEPRINNACRHFGYRLISHFPCRWDCETSLEKADKILAELERQDQALAAETMEVLNRDVFYSAELIIAVKGHDLKNRPLPLKDGNPMVAGPLDADLLQLENATLVASKNGKTTRKVDDFVWLPFESQNS
jgi:hypothetical protein